MTRRPDLRDVPRRLRSIAAQVERDGAEMLRCDDPVMHALLVVYREACPAVVFGLRAHADAMEAANG